LFSQLRRKNRRYINLTGCKNKDSFRKPTSLNPQLFHSSIKLKGSYDLPKRVQPCTHHQIQIIIMPGIFVKNDTSSAIDCFVSKYTNKNGSDDWFTLQPGAGDTWQRNDGWELVAFRHGTDRSGVYVKTGASIVFGGLGHIAVN
jgi:hypothetical protein